MVNIIVVRIQQEFTWRAHKQGILAEIRFAFRSLHNTGSHRCWRKYSRCRLTQHWFRTIHQIIPGISTDFGIICGTCGELRRSVGSRGAKTLRYSR